MAGVSIERNAPPRGWTWSPRTEAACRQGRGHRRGLMPIMASAFFALCASHAAAQSCVGDCNGDGMVSIDELIVGVNIALNALDISKCPNLHEGEGKGTRATWSGPPPQP